MVIFNLESLMFPATSTMALAMPTVFPCSLKQRLILPVQRTKTFKPLSCLELKGANGNGRMSGFHEIELQVRDYELDQFGVVNNAVYANYCQHGRHELLKSMGVNCEEVSLSGEALAMTELTIKFLIPLRSGCKFVLKTRVSGISTVRVYFEHFLFKLPNQELILEAKGTGVWLDNKNRPVRILSRIPQLRQVQLQNGAA